MTTDVRDPAGAAAVEAVTLDLDGDGIASLLFDQPGEKVNVLSFEVIDRFEKLLA